MNGNRLCFCLPDFEGDPPTKPCTRPVAKCEPNSCGPYTQCTVVNGLAKCTCLPGYVEMPNTIRGCRLPETPVVVEFCNPGSCGPNSDCVVVADKEECRCRAGFVMDYKVGCKPMVRDPCAPSPCGPNSDCTTGLIGNAVCTCRPGFVGVADSTKGCSPETTPIRVDLCAPGRCGPNSDCFVIIDREECRCKAGFMMDYKGGCKPRIRDPCIPSPCGPNTDCTTGLVGNAVCTCRPGFFGVADSTKGCGPECTTNSECQSLMACMNQKCRDPCPGACGPNAACRVVNHNPVCSCVQGFTGNAYQGCNAVPVVIEPITTERPSRPPTPSPECTKCRPECLLNSDCPTNRACIRQKCQDPCPGVCGLNAVCRVNNHSPTCVCERGYIGDPTRQCSRQRKHFFIPLLV